MTFKCNICCDSKTIQLAVYGKLEVLESGEGLPTTDGVKRFDCPQCVPMVPYRRVRATKVTTAYPAEQYGKFQMPIERSLAARFGEYLYREGLIRFTTKGSKDFGATSDQITVTAHLGVVTREDTLTAGAVPEVAVTDPPKISDRIRNRVKRVSVEAVPWTPQPGPWRDGPDDDTDEFYEPKDAVAARFSGLEIDT